MLGGVSPLSYCSLHLYSTLLTLRMITYRNWSSYTFVSFEEMHWERLKNSLECICLSWGVKSGVVFVSCLIYPESVCLQWAVCFRSSPWRTMLNSGLWSGTNVRKKKKKKAEVCPRERIAPLTTYWWDCHCWHVRLRSRVRCGFDSTKQLVWYLCWAFLQKVSLMNDTMFCLLFICEHMMSYN